VLKRRTSDIELLPRQGIVAAEKFSLPRDHCSSQVTVATGVQKQYRACALMARVLRQKSSTDAVPALYPTVQGAHLTQVLSHILNIKRCKPDETRYEKPSKEPDTLLFPYFRSQPLLLQLPLPLQ
ncbi:hypothetical protein HAX54_034347, partial [Datura stramonium]|nr:hypothetical protein [Datura stramonium]